MVVRLPARSCLTLLPRSSTAPPCTADRISRCPPGPLYTPGFRRPAARFTAHACRCERVNRCISMHELEYSLRSLDIAGDERVIFSIVLVGNQIAESGAHGKGKTWLSGPLRMSIYGRSVSRLCQWRKRRRSAAPNRRVGSLVLLVEHKRQRVAGAKAAQAVRRYVLSRRPGPLRGRQVCARDVHLA